MPPHRPARGFTLVELMLVVMLIGILTTVAIPLFNRAAARAQRAEMHVVLGKVRQHFIHIYRNTGSFPVPATVVQNPSPPPGQSAAWNRLAAGWEDLQAWPEGSLRMRYLYSTDGQQLTLQATGLFPGFDTPYTYVETWQGEAQLGIVETPEF